MITNLKESLQLLLTLFITTGVEFYKYFVLIQKIVISLLMLVFYGSFEKVIENAQTYPIMFGMAVCIGLFGIHLNNAVYSTIGADGVYYGFKLNKHVPWVTGYPFDTFRHPQYTGAWCALSSWAFMVMGPIPELAILLTFQAWSYAVTGIMEESSDNFEEQEKAGVDGKNRLKSDATAAKKKKPIKIA